jgi:hypothetical protein
LSRQSQLVNRIVLFCLLLVVPSAPTLRAQHGRADRSPTDTSLAQHVTRVKTPQTHAQADTVGVVNGVVITYGDFMSLMSGYVNEHVARTHTRIVTDDVYSMIVDTAWNRAVADILEEQEIQKRHLAMSDSEVRASLITEPPEFLRSQFTDSLGTFHADYLARAMSDPKNDSTVQTLIASARIDGEWHRLMKSILTNAKSEDQKKHLYDGWLRRTKAHARMIDRRLNFGFY